MIDNTLRDDFHFVWVLARGILCVGRYMAKAMTIAPWILLLLVEPHSI
jgi:hypothetical protein